MADYANHQFQCFVQEKDVEENLLVLQPVPENVRGVKKLDDFVKSIMGQDAQVLKQDAIMQKFQQKILDVLGPLSRLWKGLEDIKNAPDDTVPVPVEDHIKLIEQTVLLLGQASNSILYSRRFQILKTLIKDPKKAKISRRKRQIYFKKAIKIFLANSSDRMLLKQNAPKKECCRFFLVETVALLLLQKSPFGQALHQKQQTLWRRAILLR